MKATKSILLFVLCLALAPTIIHGQGGVGLPYLKIGVGARTAGMANVFTGVADDVYTLYWNPGGLGHIRMWQWSASYNRWFSDIYQASFTIVKQFRLLGSRKTTLGLSANYLGMPDWSSTLDENDKVSAGHIMGGISIGQRLDWISPWLAIGATARFISSQLDEYSSTGISTDVGLVLRPDRFRLKGAGFGLFDYGIITLGVSALHIGGDMTFDQEASTLPRSIRAGVSYKMGRYGGLTLLLASDVISVQDKDWTAGIASEIWWRDLLAARVGYRFNDEDLGELSVGIGLRWNGFLGSMFEPTRHRDALEIDVANMGYGDVLQQTYRGSISHYPVAPEPFRLDQPQVVTSHILGESSQVTLTWEEAEDPDPFDEVGYLVFVDKDQEKVNNAVHLVERDMPGFMASPLKESLMICADVPSPEYSLQFPEGGVYYWAVTAYDLGKHARLAARGEERVMEFMVATTDLMVKEIRFEHSTWITTTPEQGRLYFTVSNQGSVDADTFLVKLMDPGQLEQLYTDEVPYLGVGRDTTFVINWSTPVNGPHVMEGFVDGTHRNLELNKENNRLRETIISIPKGIVQMPDTVEVMVTGYDYTEIPLVPEVYFALNSSEVDPEFYVDGQITPGVLQSLAQRIRSNSDIVLDIMGSIDAMDGENDQALADARAESVKAVLMTLGVSDSQLRVITLHPRKVLGRGVVRDDPDDERWVGQQYRVVSFSVSQAHEETVFQPYRVAVDTMLSDGGIPVHVDIINPGEMDEWLIRANPRDIQLHERRIAKDDSLKGNFTWRGRDVHEMLVPRNRWYAYQLTLTDKLGRVFKTHPDSVYLFEKRTLRRGVMFGSAHFNSVEPIYQFYWDRVIALGDELVANPTMRIRFEGHACKIGSDEVNDRLSIRRAQAFTQAFKERVRQKYPRQYRDVWARVDEPQSYGENMPLVIQTIEHGDVLLGDNQSPVGRYLNRRTQVLLFNEN